METPTTTRPPPSLGTKLALVLASGFGAGYSPFASGTAGTFVAIPVYLGVAQLAPWLQIASTLAVTALAVVVARPAAAHWGDTDDGRIVSDEIAGYLVTMALVPPTAKAVALGFFLFRLFDVVKPWPASYFDRKMHNAVGNVMDDVAAGLFARAGLALALWLWP